jgi:hypothetical protein
MGVAYYIEIDNEELDVEEVDGKSAARAMEELNAIAEDLGVKPFDSFLGQSMDDLSDMLGEEIEPDEGVESEASWFAPSEGLVVLDGLLDALAKDPKRVKNAKRVIEDLQSYHSVLKRAEAAGARWHLAIDI